LAPRTTAITTTHVRTRPRLVEEHQPSRVKSWLRGLPLLERESFRYAIRLKSSEVSEQKITHLLIHPVGRPSGKPKVLYYNMRYRADSWGQACRHAL
jgi:hypothetical protein